MMLLMSSKVEAMRFKTPTLEEELLLHPLADGSVAVHLQFTLERDLPLNGHYNLFPKSIGEIVRHLGIHELDLTMTGGGRWLPKWGEPLPHTQAPGGAHLWAWIKPLTDVPGSVDVQWRRLTSVLAGLFCGSLEGFSDIDTTSTPSYSFPQRNMNGQFDKTAELRQASLPHEMVCTENLAPWLKLLPCREHMGLGNLLVMTHIFSLPYFSQGIRVQMIEENRLQLAQTLNFVVPAKLANIITSEDDMYKNVEWTLQKIFGFSSQSHASLPCPLATKTSVHVRC